PVYTVKDGGRTVYIGSGTSYKDTGLANGSSHTYQVTATNLYGPSSTQGTNPATVLAAPVCTAASISVSLTANPPGPLASPATTNLIWTTTGTPDSCDVSGSGANTAAYWSGAKDPAGNNEWVNNLPGDTYNFVITCHKG